MRTRILVIPSVDRLDDFACLVSHLGHYFGHLACERITIPIDPGLISSAESWLESPVMPPGFDPSTAQRVSAVRGALQLRPWPSNLQPPVLTSDLLFDWNVERSENEPWHTLRAAYRPHRTLFEIDWKGVRHGASWLAEAAMLVSRGERSFDVDGASGMAALDEEWQGVRTAYVIGTGPSVRAALGFDLSDGLRIVCNTMVLDKELMDHIRPNILTFADPIFHFGPSTYAQHFQHAVAEEARRHDFRIVTTERFAALLRGHVPALADRVIGVRQGTTSWTDNLDLVRYPAVRPYPNILTMLMLPLAATFAQEVALIGFDGRAPDDQYFWRHGSTVQFGRELDDIRQVHPGFFEVDYEDYYETHLAQVEAVCRRIEGRGSTISSMTPSYMPPLRRRTSINMRHVSEAPGTSRCLVSVTPDWINDFGHFGPFERRLHEAAEVVGLKHVSVASAGLSPDEPWQVPAITGFTSSVVRGGASFHDELSRTLELISPAPGSVVAMYAGDVWHVATFLNLATRYPHVTFVINLLKAHVWIDSALNEFNPWAASLGDLLGECLRLASGTNVWITADTEALSGDIEALTGSRPPVWPMVALTRPREHQVVSRPIDGPRHIVSPVHAHTEKGFPEVAALAARLQPELESGALRMTVRFAPQPVPVSKEAMEYRDTIVSCGAGLLTDNLSDEEFAAVIDGADVILIPYRVKPFRTRTSGVVLDALIAGKPVVTVQGTWAGDLVGRFRAGATYEEGDVDSMNEAIRDTLGRLPELGSNLDDLRGSIAEEFSASRLVEFLTGRSAGSVRVPDADSVTTLKRRFARIREVYSAREIAEESNRTRIAISHDERMRSVENRVDRIVELETSVKWHRAALEATEAKSRRRPIDAEHGRAARARLDEVELTARLLDPEGKRPGQMVDVGAHHGSSLSHFLKKGWAVHAFEPDSRHFQLLSERWGNDERVTLDGRAVAAKGGEVRAFFTSQESTGVSALAPFLASHEEAGSVETVALRDVLFDRHVNMLKTDTEGFDLEVLQSFPWERDTPDAVVCEFEDRKTKPLGYSTQDLGDFLLGKGYQVWLSEWHPIVKYGQPHDWRRIVRYPATLLDDEAWGNFIAFKRPISEDRLEVALAQCLKVEDEKDVREPAKTMSIDKQSRMIGRRDAVRGALRGGFGLATVGGLGLAVSAGVLALAGQTTWALGLAALAVVAVAAGSVITAVRLERRTRRASTQRNKSS